MSEQIDLTRLEQEQRALALLEEGRTVGDVAHETGLAWHEVLDVIEMNDLLDEDDGTE